MQTRILNHDTFDFEKSAVIRPPMKDGLHVVEKENKRYTRMVIDSRDRDTTLFPSPSKYEIQLDEEIEDVLAGELISAQVPFSSYLINQNNHRFVLTYDGGVASGVVEVETGDYTPVALAEELTAALTNLVQAAGVTTVAPFEVVHDTRKDNFIVRAKAPFSLDFRPSTCGADCRSTVGRVLGFENKLYNSTAWSAAPPATSGYGHALQAPYRKDFSVLRYLVLEVAMFTVNTSIHAPVHKSFALIKPADYLNMGVLSKTRKNFNPPVAKLARLSITFRDYDGNLYDFQNHEHQLEIMLESYKVTRRYQ